MDIERDLNDARALLSDSRKMEGGEKYRKAAKIILLKILNQEPAHGEARALLAEATGSSLTAQAPTATEIPRIREPQLPRPDGLSFTAAYTAKPVETSTPESSGGIRKLPLALTAVVVLASGWFFIRPQAATRVVKAETSTVPAAPAPSMGNSPTPVPVSETGELPPAAPTAVPATPTPVTPISTSAPRATIVQEPGSLAVNSPIAADIYMGDKYLGSTPTTLNLPAGPVSLEYRHGDLRATMTHEIKSGETTTALATFDTTVQINARPWAQVFVEGSQRRALGQTPLGSVRVPIGSVLTFENPNFSAKSYRITEKDSSIQIVFP